MILDLQLLTAYLGINAFVWLVLYGLGRGRGGYEDPGDLEDPGALPRVSVIVPLYMEKRASILRTAGSLARQKYPGDLLEVVFAVEEGDLETVEGAAEAVEILKKMGIEAGIVVLRGRRSSKGRALNRALEASRGEIVAVYDADDSLEDSQILRAVSLMISRGYAAVGTRVYRHRRSLLGRLTYIDTVIWYDLVLKTLRRAGLHVPLSGEGLFVRRDVLEQLGGFPETLAEDAYLSLMLFEKGHRVGLLDSFVEEPAPSGIASLVRQRIRWYRGHLECLARILLRGRRRLRAIASYAGPLVALSSLAGSTVATASGISQAQQILQDPGGPGRGAEGIYLAVIAAESSAPLVVIVLVLRGHRGPAKDPRLALLTILMPIYWILISAAALPSLLPRRVEWYRTQR